jgi:hypothetical protein
MWGLNDIFRKEVYGDEGQANDGVYYGAKVYPNPGIQPVVLGDQPRVCFEQLTK